MLPITLPAARMLKVGLTGGIASGKSTVARMFEALGAGIIDTDVIAREVVEPGEPALAEIRATFGDDLIDADGRLDRRRLRDLVFADADAQADADPHADAHSHAGSDADAHAGTDPDADKNADLGKNAKPRARKQLERILHPRIRARVLERLADAARESKDAPPYAIVVVPLLVETGFGALVDRVLVVDCPVEIQRRRLLAREGVGEREANAMIAAQADRQTRLDAADDVIDNSGDIAVTREQVERLHARYLSLSSDVCPPDRGRAE